MSIDEYRKGFEGAKAEVQDMLERERTQSFAERFVKGLVGLPVEAAKDLARGSRSDDELQGRRDALDGKDFSPGNKS